MSGVCLFKYNKKVNNNVCKFGLTIKVSTAHLLKKQRSTTFKQRSIEQHNDNYYPAVATHMKQCLTDFVEQRKQI